MKLEKVLSIFALCLIAISSHAKDKRPNILFLFSDDHALNAISAYKGPLSKVAPTPNIDRLANEGAIFKNSFCTNSICGPSRASIITGKHSHKNGFKINGNNGLDMNQWLMSRAMQKAGYNTAVIGKWHLINKPVGFDHWDILPGQGSYYNPVFLTDNGQEKGYKRTQIKGYATDITTDKGIAFLENRDKSKPFMLMLQHKAPHRTFAPALRHLSAFDDVSIPEPPTLFDQYKNRSVTLQANEMSIAQHFRWSYDAKIRKEERHGAKLPGWNDAYAPEYGRMNQEQRKVWDAHFGPKNKAFIKDFKAGKLSEKDIIKWQYQRYLKNYLGTVKAVDDSMGRMLKYLEDNGLAENTIVIYSSDQGFYLGEHGWYDKRWMYEESFKMPFLIKWPGKIKAGSRPRAMIQNIDYAPTFLEVAGVKIPKEVQGKSMLPMLKSLEKNHSDFRDAVYYAYYETGEHYVPQQYGVRTKRYKLVYFHDSGEWNLYDLKVDPNEMQSFYDKPEYAKVQKKMHAEYDRVRKLYDAPKTYKHNLKRKARYEELKKQKK